MSQLTVLETQIKAKIPYCQSVTWADESAYLLRVALRKKTWHDTLICLVFVSDELLEFPDVVAGIIAKQLPSEVRSAAARHGWQNKRNAGMLTG